MFFFFGKFLRVQFSINCTKSYCNSNYKLICNNCWIHITVRIVLMLNLKCPQPPPQLSPAEIMMFHLPKSFLGTNCVTRREDTPIDASSISEEDIIEICVTKDHTHPLGVLYYSAMESVVPFCSMDELQCATHQVVKTMELQVEAITVRAMAPSEAYITVYVATSHSNPSNGRESHIHLPNKLP